METPLAVLGAVAVTVAAPSLPYAMGFAAGEMSYVIGDESVPGPTSAAPSAWRHTVCRSARP